MKKAVIFAVIAGCLTLAAAPLQAQAAPAQVQTKVISANKIVNADGNSIKDYFNNSKWENATVIKFPCKPGTPEIEVPGESVPSVPSTPSKPETPENKPEDKPSLPGNKPETPDNKPETGNPGDVGQSEHAYVLRIVELVNAERAKAGLKPLTLQKDVTKAAQVRAVEIEKSFSHTRPNGTNFATALKRSGVSYRGSGENIAWGQKTPEEVMKGWMNSPGHRANILNAKYTSIGVGYHQNGTGTNYWSQLFTY